MIMDINGGTVLSIMIRMGVVDFFPKIFRTLFG